MGARVRDRFLNCDEDLGLNKDLASEVFWEKLARLASVILVTL